MTFILTPVYSDSFAAAHNPIDSTHWQAVPTDPEPQTTGGFLRTTVNDGNFEPALYTATGSGFSANQYAQGDMYLAGTGNLNNGASLYLQMNSTINNFGLYFSVTDNGAGSAKLLYLLADGVTQGSTIVSFTSGQTFQAIVIGTTFWGVQAGSVVVTVSGIQNAAGATFTGVDIASATLTTDVGMKNFVTGTAALSGPGPAGWTNRQRSFSNLR